jgi:glycerate kinase
MVDENVYKFLKNDLVSIFSIVPYPVSLEESIKNAKKYLKIKINQILKIIKTCL